MAEASPWPCAPLGAVCGAGRPHLCSAREPTEGAPVSAGGRLASPWQCLGGGHWGAMAVQQRCALSPRSQIRPLGCSVVLRSAGVGARRPGRGSRAGAASRLTKQGGEQDRPARCRVAHSRRRVWKPVRGPPLRVLDQGRGRPLQLARGPPRAHRPCARAAVQATGGTCLPHRAWHL